MSRRRQPFAMHVQHVWEERSADRRLPMWLRLAALAYGMHDSTGHAPFAAGQLGLILGHVDPTTGEVVEVDKANVQRAIREAKRAGWLADESGTRCLVVPEHAITGGKPVNPRTRCHHFRS